MNGALTDLIHAIQSIAAAIRPNQGNCVGIAYTNYSSVATTTVTVPNDDTIPQNTEGAEFMSVSITPKSATNILEVTVSADISHSVTTSYIISSLFQDSNVNALYTHLNTNPTGTAPSPTNISFCIPAGTTNQTTFKFRSGSSSAGTLTFNGQSSIRHFGTVTKSSITVKEYQT